MRGCCLTEYCKILCTDTSRTQLGKLAYKVVLLYMRANKQLPTRTIDDSIIVRSAVAVQHASA